MVQVMDQMPNSLYIVVLVERKPIFNKIKEGMTTTNSKLVKSVITGNFVSPPAVKIPQITLKYASSMVLK